MPAFPPTGDPRQRATAGTSKAAIASLVLGVLSLVTCLLTGIPAVVCGIVGLVKVGNSGGRLRGSGLAITGIVLGGLGTLGTVLLIALALPVLNSAREKGREMESLSNLHNLSAAIINHDVVERRYPANIVDSEGQPLLSWRVKLLPYLEQEALYRKFHLDEPWDSPHNRELIAEMPRYFASPFDPDAGESGKTTYFLPVGESTAFEDLLPGKAPGSQLPMSSMRLLRADGLSNTILIVEVDPERAVEWTKPDDWHYDRRRPTEGLPTAAPHVLVAFADGKVKALSSKLATTTWQKLFSYDGPRFKETSLTPDELEQP